MLHLSDIIHKVACELHDYPQADGELTLEAFMARHAHDFNIGITDDVEESEIYFHHKYGEGQTFYFNVEDYGEGKRIAAELFHFFTGETPFMERYNGEQFTNARPLLLFLHIRKAAVKTTILD